MTKKITALIMAGKRSGVLDPLAERAGVSQKCVAPVSGRPMIEHVVEAVSRCEHIAEIRIVAHEPEEIRAIPLVGALEKSGRLVFKEGAFNIVDSVFAGAEGADFPVMLTTADNCLVTPEGYSEFIEKALAAGAGAAAALARKQDVQGADPEGQKKFYEFSDGGYSNCNTYWIGSEEALSAAEIMREGGQFVKFPRRIAKAFGTFNLIRFYLGWGTKEGIFEQVSRRFGFKMCPIVMSNGEFAIDVDNFRTFEVTERLLAKRANKDGASKETGSAASADKPAS
jgi:GTP:adenosylcobinamide-phosphate guanylyltransferase